ncbi:MAG: DUF6786 family protein, partial [Chthoniobacterales bacterium]
LGALTIVRFEPVVRDGRYVNSMWEKQENPSAGDVIHAFNDGSPAPGEPPLGPFYELETSSPGAELSPGASLTHKQVTVHLAGQPEQLDPIAKAKLGAGIAEIRDAFVGGQ